MSKAIAIYMGIPTPNPFVPDFVVPVAYQGERGFFVEDTALRELMTPEQVAADILNEAEMEAYYSAFPDSDDWAYPALEFPSLDLALQYHACIAQYNFISCELDAYNAPRECGEIAMRHLDSEITALKLLAV